LSQFWIKHRKIAGALTKLSDPEAMTKYQKLVKDWGDIIGAGK